MSVLEIALKFEGDIRVGIYHMNVFVKDAAGFRKLKIVLSTGNHP